MGELNSIRHLEIENEICEYILVALPGKEVSGKVKEEKESFSKTFQHIVGLESEPHVTVARYIAKERMEERLEKWVQNICHLQNSFTVTLNNYSGFPPHTIYLRIQEAEPFIKLANALRILDGFMEMNDCPFIQVSNKPYLTVVDQLSEGVYESAIKEYSRKSFHESFQVERLALLKGDAYMRYRLINTFILAPAGSQS